MWKGILALMIAGLCLTARAEQGADATLAERLNPAVLELLRQEMRALADAVDQVPSHLARGNWEKVEEIGTGIHDSFILKQEMTASQRRHLQETLPDTFKQMDKRFHEQAASLAQSASERDAHASVNTLRDMLYSCVNCHRQFAPERFPTLEKPR